MSNDDKDWHSLDIQKALKQKGLTLTSLSLRSNLASSTLRNAMRVSYPKAEKIIADAIGVPASEIWPSRYTKS